MKRAYLLFATTILAATIASATAADAPKTEQAKAETGKSFFSPTESKTSGSVTVEGHTIDYQAVAGTIIVHPKGWDDAPQEKDSKNPDAEASIFYVAYFKKGEKPGSHLSQ